MKGTTAATQRKKKSENIKPKLFSIIDTDEEKTSEELTKQI